MWDQAMSAAGNVRVSAGMVTGNGGPHAPTGHTARAPTAAELQDLMNIGCWEWDVGADTFVWNAGMFAIYGLSPQTFTPTKRTLLDRIAPQDMQRVRDIWWKDSDVPPAGALECGIKRPDGQLRRVRYVWHTVQANGAGTKVFGFAQDITAFSAAETGLGAEDAHLRGMVECSADYIWEYRGAGNGVLTDGMTLESLTTAARAPDGQGGETEAGAGKPVFDAASDYDFSTLAQIMDERANFRDMLVPIVDGRGEPRWINLSGHPQFDRAGAYCGYRGVGADVTDSIRERSLADSRRQAGAVGRLASGLAHEINNLLQPILIYSTFGADEAKAHDKLRLYFSRITRAAERASFIVKNVLAFARRTPPHQEALNVPAVVRDTIDLMSGAVGAQTKIELTSADDNLIARCERTGLSQIVTNLIANAADAMAAASVGGEGRILVRIDSVTITTETSKTARVAPGRYGRITVEDTGPGISPEVIGKIFDPFFTTKPQGKGTGLGLAVVAGIAKSWGGSATVESTPGQGSTFRVYLPTTARELQAAQ